MAPNNPIQYYISREVTEVALADMLSNGYSARKPNETKSIVHAGQNLFVRLTTKYEDCNFHADIELRDIDYLTHRYDEKHRALPTSYTNFSINTECFEYLEKARVTSFDEHQRYWFAFALDDGKNYTGEYLIVKAFDVLDLPHKHKSFKADSKKGFFCIDEKILMDLPSALIIKADF